MAKFKLEISTDNSAFDDRPASELARILREVAEAIEQDGEFDGAIRDINGNTVGSRTLKGAEADRPCVHVYDIAVCVGCGAAQ